MVSITESAAIDLPVVPLLINGSATTAKVPRQFAVYNYEQRKDVHHAESADRDAACRAADAALNAFQTWKNTSVVTRRQLLLRYATLLREREQDIVDAQRQETGVSEQWAKKNVQLAANLIDETAACISSLKGEIPATETPGSLALAFMVPVGPILTIAPYVYLVHPSDYLPSIPEYGLDF